MSDSQTAQILDHLKKGRVITPLKALHRFGCLRLAARIKDLRNDGHPILKEWETDGHKKWARYSLAPAREG
jgi:hypothetical protein